MANVVREADLISGVLVDVTKETLNWLHDLLSRNAGEPHVRAAVAWPKRV